jgi:RNA polymerase sigma factor (sigma-70 family)
MKEIPEKDLIAGLKGKDSMICSHLFVTFFPVIMGYITPKVSNIDDAKDIAQESLTTLCVKANSFPQLSNLTDVKKILYGIVRNKVNSYIREKMKSHSFMQEYIGLTNLSEDPVADGKLIRDNEIHFEIHQHLNSLGGQAKEIIDLLYKGNHTIKEISDKLETSQGNVRNQHYKVLKKLREILIKYKSGVIANKAISSMFFQLLSL